MSTITMRQVEALRAAGRVVAVYPRKRIARVDGFKVYMIVKTAKPASAPTETGF